MIQIETTTGEVLQFEPTEKVLLVRYGLPVSESLYGDCTWGAEVGRISKAKLDDWIGVGDGNSGRIVQVAAVRRIDETVNR